MSFNGTRSAATRGVNNDFELTTTPAKTPELWLEDKCESENFLFLDGQEVHIEGSIQGTLEIVISNDICETACDDDDICDAIALVFHNPNDPTAAPTEYSYNTLCNADFAFDPRSLSFLQPVRFFVKATKGAHSLCEGTCYNQD